MSPQDQYNSIHNDADKPLVHSPQIDGLRAIAVGGVLYWHWIPTNYHFGFWWGPAGVQLFFVISGFLITRILIRCWNNPNRIEALRSFYIRRVLRIFPVFYLVLGLYCIASIQPVREAVLWHVTYLSNFHFLQQDTLHVPAAHFWSLAVEEQFYLFWPLLVIFLPRRWLIYTIIILIVIGTLSRIVLPIYYPETWVWIVLPNANFLFLGIGALLASTAEKLNSSKWINLLSFAGLVFLLLFSINYFGVPIPGFVLDISLALTFCWFIVGCVEQNNGILFQMLGLRWLTYLGKISYGIYVFHDLVGITIHRTILALGLTNLGRIEILLLKILITISIASASWHLMEKPIMRLKSRFEYFHNISSSKQRS